MHSAHIRAPLSAFYDFHDTSIVRVVKNISENKKNVDNHIQFFF